MAPSDPACFHAAIIRIPSAVSILTRGGSKRQIAINSFYNKNIREGTVTGLATSRFSGHYFRACREFPVLEVVACADLLPERARAQAEEFGIARVLTAEELLADDTADLVVNLTVPAAHDAVSRRHRRRQARVEREAVGAGARRRRGTGACERPAPLPLGLLHGELH